MHLTWHLITPKFYCIAPRIIATLSPKLSSNFINKFPSNDPDRKEDKNIPVG